MHTSPFSVIAKNVPRAGAANRRIECTHVSIQRSSQKHTTATGASTVHTLPTCEEPRNISQAGTGTKASTVHTSHSAQIPETYHRHRIRRTCSHCRPKYCAEGTPRRGNHGSPVSLSCPGDGRGTQEGAKECQALDPVQSAHLTLTCPPTAGATGSVAC